MEPQHRRLLETAYHDLEDGRFGSLYFLSLAYDLVNISNTGNSGSSHQ